MSDSVVEMMMGWERLVCTYLGEVLASPLYKKKKGWLFFFYDSLILISLKICPSSLMVLRTVMPSELQKVGGYVAHRSQRSQLQIGCHPQPSLIFAEKSTMYATKMSFPPGKSMSDFTKSYHRSRNLKKPDLRFGKNDLNTRSGQILSTESLKFCALSHLTS